MTSHPTETELALLAGDECGPVSKFLLNRHVRECETCLETVAQFVALRREVAAQDPDVEWDLLEAEMRANIHLGLEAGECVRGVGRGFIWNPRVAVAFASLLLLLGAGVLLRAPHPSAAATAADRAEGISVVRSSGAGLELQNGGSSLTLFNHHGSVSDQTVSAQGVVRASYIDSGGVTINNVYLE